uniref:C2H2-type domain-containing protein n=1 Tax=Knipowitschia caucasica TaxID=637954 RepID=A0AAV2IUA2_KNICA
MHRRPEPVGIGLPLASLRLMASPLQLTYSFIWQVLKQKNVNQYEKVEDFVNMVTQTVPDIISYKQKAQLLLGLRAKIILDLLNTDDQPDTRAIQTLINKLKVPTTTGKDTEVEKSQTNFMVLVQNLLKSQNERKQFFKEVFPVQYGTKFDTALQALIAGLVCKLEQFIPVPNLTQLGTMISTDPAILEACGGFIPDPGDLRTLLLHQQAKGMLGVKATVSSSVGDSVLSSLAFRLKSSDLSPEPPKPIEDTQTDNCPDSPSETGDLGVISDEEDAPFSNPTSAQSSKPPGEGSVAKENTVPSTTHLEKENQTSQVQSQCGKCFSKLQSLTKHMLAHSGQKPFYCNICNKGFTQSTYFKRHMECHTSQMTFPCKQCNKTFPTAFKLANHERWHTRDRPHMCERCGKRFLVPSLLKRHMGYHIGDRQYLCSQCGKTFVYLSDLKRHQQDHIPKPKIPCPVCQKKFSSKYCLRVHLRIHTRERPYRCTLCEKTFTQVGNLKVHIRLHTNERPFSCDVCGKTYKLASHLNVHKRTHTCKKPWNCVTCGKGFSVPGLLKKHEQLHVREADPEFAAKRRHRGKHKKHSLKRKYDEEDEGSDDY